jgi:hypothetical protein
MKKLLATLVASTLPIEKAERVAGPNPIILERVAYG